MSASNGGNPRLDRIEKMIERSERRNEEARARSDLAHARHDREIAEIRAIGRQTRDEMRRWTRLGVKEARSHRKQMLELNKKVAAADREFDLKMTQLASAQLLTEQMLQSFLASRTNGHNGKTSK